MIQVGILNAYFPYTLEESAKRIRALDFNTVQLDLVFKDMELDVNDITVEKCRTIRDTFRRHNLPICCISGYTNLIHPDPNKRKANLDMLKQIIRHARELGSPLCHQRDRHLRPGQRLGPPPEEQDAGGL